MPHCARASLRSTSSRREYTFSPVSRPFLRASLMSATRRAATFGADLTRFGSLSGLEVELQPTDDSRFFGGYGEIQITGPPSGLTRCQTCSRNPALRILSRGNDRQLCPIAAGFGRRFGAAVGPEIGRFLSDDGRRQSPESRVRVWRGVGTRWDRARRRVPRPKQAGSGARSPPPRLGQARHRTAR